MHQWSSSRLSQLLQPPRLAFVDFELNASNDMLSGLAEARVSCSEAREDGSVRSGLFALSLKAQEYCE